MAADSLRAACHPPTAHFSAAALPAGIWTTVGSTGLACVSSTTRATNVKPCARCLFKTARPIVAVVAIVLAKAEVLGSLAAAVAPPALSQAAGAAIAMPWHTATHRLAYVTPSTPHTGSGVIGMASQLQAAGQRKAREVDASWAGPDGREGSGRRSAQPAADSQPAPHRCPHARLPPA